MDDLIARSLCVHIQYLIPSTYDLEISATIQSAALIGAGLLYCGTFHKLMS